jgi:hypothetical protein
MIHTEARGGSPYGASTITGPKGELAPMAEDLAICHVQRKPRRRNRQKTSRLAAEASYVFGRMLFIDGGMAIRAFEFS